MLPSTEENFLESARKLFRYYKTLGDKAIDQLDEAQVRARPNEESNSIALIVHHLSGNMLSRWTDFLTTDGEKPWRNREAEFEEGYADKKAMMEAWHAGWNCLLQTLDSLNAGDLSKIIYIRNEGQTVLEAIQRQLAHYPMHVGQIIYQAKILKGVDFQSLSIPKGNSAAYNQKKFEQERERRHFTDQV
ncbi:MAG: hypothetical protein DI538_02675 [Azospira oryzae]|nr:MAG: hypothetical protein DI538_02675 [Azospira oryzae]